MNKKGFTLVEIIGVVVVLGVIALLAFPPMLNMVRNSENKVSEATKNLIYTASMQYTTKYINDFPKNENKVYCVTLEKLVQEEFLSSTITNNLGDFNLQSYVQVKVNSELKFDYDLVKTCNEVR